MKTYIAFILGIILTFILTYIAVCTYMLLMCSNALGTPQHSNLKTSGVGA